MDCAIPNQEDFCDLYLKNLIPIRTEGTRLPFFWVHGFGGALIGGAVLGRLLGPDQPFYGLQAKGLDGEETPQTTIEEMASLYIDAITTIRPHGPYYLGGYCIGGVIAFEMACQLQSKNEAVGLLALVESSPPSHLGQQAVDLNYRTISLFVRNIPGWFRSYRRLGLAEGFARACKRVKIETKEVLIKHGVPMRSTAADIVGADVKKFAPFTAQLMEMQHRALRTYVPRKYEGRVTLFRVGHLPLLKGGNPLLGWDRYAGDLELKIIPGVHQNVLQQPNVQVVARVLRGCIDRTLGGSSTTGEFYAGINEI